MGANLKKILLQLFPLVALIGCALPFEGEKAATKTDPVKESETLQEKNIQVPPTGERGEGAAFETALLVRRPAPRSFPQGEGASRPPPSEPGKGERSALQRPPEILRPEDEKEKARPELPELKDLKGKTLKAIEEALGPPDSSQGPLPARVWFFRAKTCELSLFFYPSADAGSTEGPKNPYRLLAFEAKGLPPKAERMEPQACLDLLDREGRFT